MADKTVPLSKSYDVNGQRFGQIELREPTYHDIFVDGLGYPREVQPVKGGAALMVYPEVVDQYAQRLVIAPGYEFIHELNASDSKKLEGAICGFFTAPMALTASETSSSSGSDGTQAPSVE